jgi:hypothetical protein
LHEDITRILGKYQDFKIGNWVIRNEDQMIWASTSNTPKLNIVVSFQSDIAELVINKLSRPKLIENLNYIATSSANFGR